MLTRDKLIAFFLLCFCIQSCNNKNKGADIVNEYIRKNFNQYSHIYQIAKDSIYKWNVDSLKAIGSCCFYDFYMLDSAFFFNKDKTLLITSINQRAKFKNIDADYFQLLCGNKINNKWYFFLGGTYVIPREVYQDSVFSPFTFAELSYIAHKVILSDAIIQNSDGTFSSNEIFFKYYFDKSRWAADSCTTRASFDSLIVYRAGEKYKHKLDKKEIERIKIEIKNSVRPPEPPGLWFRKLISTKPFN